MKNEFWLERWQKQEIGFHQDQFNSNLQKHWPNMVLPEGCQVFVPLCGKTLDMVYLAERGHDVLGVELSALAAEEFFKEQGLVAKVSQDGAFQRFSSGPFTILAGDFFELSKDQLKNCKAIYDRAALIALPEDIRTRYCAKTAEIMSPGCQSLLLTLEYPQDELSPPPFSISKKMVEALQSSYCEWHFLESSSTEVRGHPAQEHCFHLRY